MTQVRANGFSLVELMASMAVLSLLCVLLYSTVSASSDAWTQCERKLEAFREARAALHIISRDLQSALKLPQKDCFYAMQRRGENGNISIIGGTGAPKGHGDCLFFLCAQPSGINGGDLAIVGYYLSYWRDKGESKESFKLHRYCRNSQESFLLLADRLSGVPVTFANAESGIGNDGVMRDEILARYIIDFDIVPYRRDQNGNLVRPADPFEKWPAGEIPALVDISLSAYDTSSAVRLNNLTDWVDTDSAFARQNLRKFSTKVALEASP